MEVDKLRPFIPAKGLSNRHLQTLIPVFMGRNHVVQYVRQELSLPDGDFIDLDWTSIPEPGLDKPILLIFHGLEGSSQSHYAKSLMQVAREEGWHAVVMHFRSCSGRLNNKPRLYHSGETGDAGYFIEWLRQQYPFAPLYAVGFSLGGNMLLKLAGEQGDKLPLDALISVSAPVKLSESTHYMVKGVSRLYQSYLLKGLKQKMLEKYKYHDYKSLIGLDRKSLAQCKDIREFDNLVTARIHGFKDAEDYYSRSSAFPYIPRIKKTCLIIHAEDDPISPKSVLPNATELPGNIQLEVSRKGGHVGFLEGSILKLDSWLPKRILSYIS